ncbi:hypothetical protein OJF2_24860 [Aquisphaera giovannonii]|uniref:Uncharacterized protein n=1 Tax=Aquisphaera giovannonii TaxID=406548 RepID=A0A5B9W0A6_9BACT|nr:hypothetical protein [Aquisphaera giovannonii]QEH33953.1 hypothetical protein OJF2_24860 [Aquisphaera giovannonii]
MARPKSSRNDVQVKIDANVAQTAKIVAAYRDTTVAELVSEILRPILEQMEQEEIARRAAGTAAQGE